MNLDKYPLEIETDDGLMIRLSEECAEVIMAVCKCQRFGFENYHPDRPDSNNLRELLKEISDVVLCIKEFRRRASHEFQADM